MVRWVGHHRLAVRAFFAVTYEVSVQGIEEQSSHRDVGQKWLYLATCNRHFVPFNALFGAFPQEDACPIITKSKKPDPPQRIRSRGQLSDPLVAQASRAGVLLDIQHRNNFACGIDQPIMTAVFRGRSRNLLDREILQINPPQRGTGVV